MTIATSADTETTDVTTLRIKTESGNTVLNIKMRYDQTLVDLTNLIASHRETRGKFVYRTTYPVTTYESSDTRTFVELGLVPNQTMMICSRDL